MKIFAVCAATFLWLCPTALQATEAPMGWPEVIERLAQERTRAEICVGLLKSRGDKAVVERAEATYGLAKADSDGVIAGLTTVLVEGGKPETLPSVRQSLESSGTGLKEICDAAVKTATPNTRGLWDEIAKGPLEPLIKAISDGIAGLWGWKIGKDKLVLKTEKGQLEAAKWPDFGDIEAR